MFVAVKKITEFGQPVFCVNPVETTIDINQAFTWNTKDEAQMVLNEAKKIYNLDAVAVEIVKSKAILQMKQQESLKVG